MRALVAVVAIGCLSAAAPGSAQADDPAIIACEAVIRGTLPDGVSYARQSATIAGASVLVHYQTSSVNGAFAQARRRCDFSYNPAKGEWTFVQVKPPEVAACEVFANRTIALMQTQGVDAAAPRRKRLAECLEIQKAELRRQAQPIPAIAALIMREIYPLQAFKTRLQAGL